MYIKPFAKLGLAAPVFTCKPNNHAEEAREQTVVSASNTTTFSQHNVTNDS